MISVERQQQLLLSVSQQLKHKVTAYAIGGTAMMFLGIKESTLDIDLVFETEEDRKLFRTAIEKLGYRELDAVKIYGLKRNRPEMLTRLDERFDLFVDKVVNFSFSDGMKKRAVQTHQFGENLVMKIADPHDIIIMKCATDRLKDRDDVRSIIAATKIDWDLVIEALKEQIKLGQETAAFELGCFLEELRNKMRIDLPIEALDKLFEIVKKQSQEKQKLMRKKKPQKLTF